MKNSCSRRAAIHITMIVAFFLIWCKCSAYFDPGRMRVAIDSGNDYYYRDKSEILFRYDQYYHGGASNLSPLNRNFTAHLNQSEFLLPLRYLDLTIFQTDRALPSTAEFYFYYEIPLRIPGTYNLILCFIETQYQNEGERRFDIVIENYQFKQRYDIIKEAGGQMVAVYETLEFQYRNDMIHLKDRSTIDMKDNKLTFKVFFRGKGAKVDGLMLYSGSMQNILYDLNSAMVNESRIDKLYSDQVEFAQEAHQKALKYSLGYPPSLTTKYVKMYLSPFQSVILHHLEEDMLSNLTSHMLLLQQQNQAPHFLQQYFDQTVTFTLQHFEWLIFWTFHFLSYNKLLLGILLVNFYMLWRCFSASSIRGRKFPSATTPLGSSFDDRSETSSAGTYEPEDTHKKKQSRFKRKR